MSDSSYHLAIDVGNTTIEWGLFREEGLQHTFALSSVVPRLADEFWHHLTLFLADHNLSSTQIKAVGISSVVPEHTAPLVEMSRRLCSEPMLVSERSYFYPVRVKEPSSVGADRLCGALAGYHRLGGPLLVVDFGTAITLDLVAEDGAYLGGIIMPGPLTSARSLHRRTAQLPSVEITFPESLIGTSTEEAIRSGVTYGVIEMVDGLIEKIEREQGVPIKVIATGGGGAPFAQRSRRFTFWVPHLVLEGIALMLKRAHSQT